jgi:hypothetical protein
MNDARYGFFIIKNTSSAKVKILTLFTEIYLVCATYIQLKL